MKRRTFIGERALSPSCSVPGQRKINVNFYFHTSLWCLKRFYEDLKGLHKTFWDATEKCENENLSKFLFYYSFLKCTGREGLYSKCSNPNTVFGFEVRIREDCCFFFINVRKRYCNLGFELSLRTSQIAKWIYCNCKIVNNTKTAKQVLPKENLIRPHIFRRYIHILFIHCILLSNEILLITKFTSQNAKKCFAILKKNCLRRTKSVSKLGIFNAEWIWNDNSDVIIQL